MLDKTTHLWLRLAVLLWSSVSGSHVGRCEELVPVPLDEPITRPRRDVRVHARITVKQTCTKVVDFALSRAARRLSGRARCESGMPGPRTLDCSSLLVALAASPGYPDRGRSTAPHFWSRTFAHALDCFPHLVAVVRMCESARRADAKRPASGSRSRSDAGRSTCSPEQIRTAVSALRGRRPRPLDDGAGIPVPPDRRGGAGGAGELGGEDSNPQRQGQNLLCCRLHHPRRSSQDSQSRYEPPHP